MKKKLQLKFASRLLSVLMILSLTFFVAGCGSTYTAAGQDHYIIEAKDAMNLIDKDKVVLIDVQSPEGYTKEHIKGSISLDRDKINVTTPVPGVLAPKELFEKVMGDHGISNDSTVVLYDNDNNMNSSRLWWALKIYGHENIKVVSGGITALKVAGAEVSTEVPSITATSYSAKDLNTNMLATIDEVKAQVNTPDKNTILLDARSEKEYDEGTVPSSILLNYENNIYNDKTFKSPQDIKIMYLENKIKPSNNIIMFCKTSVRAAQTYLVLYEAGYKNLKLYDGAWLEWDADKSLPIQIKNMENNNTTLPTSQDNS